MFSCIILNLDIHVWPTSLFTFFGSVGCPSHYRCHSRVDWAGSKDTSGWKVRFTWCLCHRIGWNYRYTNNSVLERVVSLFFYKILISFLGAGDIESMPFIEALGQFSYRVGKDIIYATSQYTSVKPDLLIILIKCLLFLNTSHFRDRELLLDSCQPCACFKCCWWTGKLLRNCNVHPIWQMI